MKGGATRFTREVIVTVQYVIFFFKRPNSPHYLLLTLIVSEAQAFRRAAIWSAIHKQTRVSLFSWKKMASSIGLGRVNTTTKSHNIAIILQLIGQAALVNV